MELFDSVRGSSDPNRYWTFTNAAEATPDIMSPLCWSVWGDPLEDGFRRTMYAIGVLAKHEVVVSPNQQEHLSSPIYGRQAFNVDVLRPVMSRISRKVADDFERDVLGTVRPDAPAYPAMPQRLPVIAVKAPYMMLRLGRLVERNHADTKAWWKNHVLDVYRGAARPRRNALEDLVASREQFTRSFYLHTLVRYQLAGVHAMVSKVAEKIDRTELGVAALAAQGGVAETLLADDVWRMAQGEIGIDEFIGEHGFHGPNEGNVYTKSWREQPQRVVALAETQTKRIDSVRPLQRAEQAAAETRCAADELIASASGTDRTILRFALNRARSVIPRLETGKAGYVMPLDGARAAARRLGEDLVDSGRLDEIDDAFFLTIPELRSIVDGRLPHARDLIAHRRDAREHYAAMTLPVSFAGMPEPIAVVDSNSEQPDALRGLAAGGGVVEGRARVVTDPNDDVDLDEGDILVCRFTDPSWAPLFTLASALVIDIGGAASHGAVVAREMGIPFVIGTQTGTTTIRTGDLIQVDGENNVVRVLQKRHLVGGNPISGQ